jgi:hypothetical protein
LELRDTDGHAHLLTTWVDSLYTNDLGLPFDPEGIVSPVLWRKFETQVHAVANSQNFGYPEIRPLVTDVPRYSLEDGPAFIRGKALDQYRKADDLAG